MFDLRNEIVQILFEATENNSVFELKDDEPIDFDSLDRLLFAFEIEDYFDIIVLDEEVDSWKCLNDVIATVQKYHEADKNN